MQETKHTINKISINASGIITEKIFSWRARMSEYLNDRFPYQAQALFDELSPADKLLTIDRLHIKLNLNVQMTFEHIEQEVLISLRKALINTKQEQLLLYKKENNEDINNNTSRRTVQAWLHYLQYAYYPWYQQYKINDQDFEKIIIEQWTYIQKELPLILRQPEATHRFAMTISNSSLLTLLSLFAKDSFIADITIEELKELVLQKNITFIPVKLALANIISAEGQTEIKKKVTALRESIAIIKSKKNNEIKALLKKQDREISKNSTAHSKEIWIQNGGLILLHPFIPKLFKRLNITNAKNKITDFEKALAAIHYLLYANNSFAEEQMILPKLLCGLDYTNVLLTELQLSDAEKEECDVLLRSVIEHWAALKKTSVPGLIQTFLLRKAKLFRIANGWQLQVERKTEDVLLERLPWSIAIIKLPWMNEMISVEWR